jgi:hypothetical protein
VTTSSLLGLGRVLCLCLSACLPVCLSVCLSVCLARVVARDAFWMGGPVTVVASTKKTYVNDTRCAQVANYPFEFFSMKLFKRESIRERRNSERSSALQKGLVSGRRRGVLGEEVCSTETWAALATNSIHKPFFPAINQLCYFYQYVSVQFVQHSIVVICADAE